VQSFATQQLVGRQAGCCTAFGVLRLPQLLKKYQDSTITHFVRNWVGRQGGGGGSNK